uniref:Uncharacterized protein n=1 Tax=Romanomermis culicivorax TaxID=13658 RepID=A0A915IF40_ROMCU
MSNQKTSGYLDFINRKTTFECPLLHWKGTSIYYLAGITWTILIVIIITMRIIKSVCLTDLGHYHQAIVDTLLRFKEMAFTIPYRRTPLPTIA